MLCEMKKSIKLAWVPTRNVSSLCCLETQNHHQILDYNISIASSYTHILDDDFNDSTSLSLFCCFIFFLHDTMNGGEMRTRVRSKIFYRLICFDSSNLSNKFKNYLFSSNDLSKKASKNHLKIIKVLIWKIIEEKFFNEKTKKRKKSRSRLLLPLLPSYRHHKKAKIHTWVREFSRSLMELR